MNSSRHIDVRLSLTPGQVRHYYSGSAESVLAQSVDGRTVRFPATVLPRLVSEHGVHGVFRLVFDEESRLVEVQALAAEDQEVNSRSRWASSSWAA